MDVRNTIYFKQVDLLLKILPIVSRIEDFALKGGTAINWFVQDFPRLSVDIDLTYLLLRDRDLTIKHIDVYLKEIGTSCQKYIPGVTLNYKEKQGLLYGLTVSSNDTVVKIEPNSTIRGSVFAPVNLSLAKNVEEMFGRTMEIRALSVEDLYGGKICAALDRQHPRDLFDIYYMYQKQGLTDKIRQAFIVYLLSHNRPISELLNPTLKGDLDETYKENFEGMAFKEVSLPKLVDVWHELVRQINKHLTDQEREFILSVKNKAPNWDLFPMKGIQKLPSIQWKLINLDRMPIKKHSIALNKLESVLIKKGKNI